MALYKCIIIIIIIIIQLLNDCWVRQFQKLWYLDNN